MRSCSCWDILIKKFPAQRVERILVIVFRRVMVVVILE